VRWLSPEAIAWQKFTPKSDSWSFGVVMWEIFSGGKLPFSEHGDDDEERVEEMIAAGCQLACPAGCPEEVFRIMESCWAADPDQRPTMYDLGNKLADLDYGRDGDGPDSEDDSSDSSDGESAESDDGATSTTSDEVYSSDGSGSQAVYASLRDSR
jgi:serine/threonine protein kinase